MIDMIPMTPATSYATEIRSMLFGFGDCDQPLMETAQLVEEIANDQLKLILFKSSEVAERRGSKTVSLEDVLFLMRKNPVKVQRLMKYLSIKDVAATVQNPNDLVPETKRVKRCRDFIDKIDTNGQLIKAANEELYDEVRMERLRRMDQLSRTLDGKKYVEFTRARQVNFLGLKLKFQQKFHDWLTKGTEGWFEMKIDKSGLEIFSYLAYETVGQVVELALLVRRDMGGHADVLSRTMSAPMTFSPQFPTMQTADESSPLRKRLKSGEVNGVEDEVRLLQMRPLKAEHVQEAVRRLAQMPRSAFGWGDRLDGRHQRSEVEMPILAL